MELEFCAENNTLVGRAIESGATRIELCDNLAVGGTTPSYGVIKETVELAHSHGVRAMVMIRPRGGSFEYDERELGIMETDIEVAAELGADGVVFGCLRDGWVDESANRRLLDRAQEMDVTFHMAFDEIMPSAQFEALDALVSMGFSRVLTHGGPLDEPIERCLPRLRELVAKAGNRIAIMPGGGVTWQNAESICAELGVREVHGTRIVKW